MGEPKMLLLDWQEGPGASYEVDRDGVKLSVVWGTGDGGRWWVFLNESEYDEPLFGETAFDTFSVHLEAGYTDLAAAQEAAERLFFRVRAWFENETRGQTDA